MTQARGFQFNAQIPLILPSSSRTPTYPMGFIAKPLKLTLVSPPDFAWAMKTHKMNKARLLYPSARNQALGNIFGDIWDFIKKIISNIIDAITKIIMGIIHFFQDPIGTIKAVWHELGVFVKNGMFLGWLENSCLTRWLFRGIDWLTGGFLTNLKNTLGLPGKVMLGEKITRRDLMVAISVVATLVAVALTGGLLSASFNAIKSGPIGKTLLGALLVGTVGATVLAIVSGGDVVSALSDYGEDEAKDQATDALAAKTGVPADAISISSGSAIDIVQGDKSLTDIGIDAAKDTTTSSMMPEPVRVAANATYSANDADQGSELTAAKDSVYDSLQDKNPVAAYTLKTMSDPASVADSIKSGASSAVDVVSDPGGAVSDAASSISDYISNPTLPSIDPGAILDTVTDYLTPDQQAQAAAQKKTTVKKVVVVKKAPAAVPKFDTTPQPQAAPSGGGGVLAIAGLAIAALIHFSGDGNA